MEIKQALAQRKNYVDFWELGEKPVKEREEILSDQELFTIHEIIKGIEKEEISIELNRESLQGLKKGYNVLLTTNEGKTIKLIVTNNTIYSEGGIISCLHKETGCKMSVVISKEKIEGSEEYQELIRLRIPSYTVLAFTKK